MTGAELLVKQLEAYGVEVVFGLCGHTNIAVLAAMEHSGVRFISVRHEQVAAHAADGYARVTGKPGVVLLHVGPGVTNATTGVATAALDSIPLVVIAGDVPAYYFGHNPHQEVNLHLDGDQFEIYRPFVKRAWRVTDVRALPDVVYQAFRLAESGRPGPVLVDVTMDVFSRKVYADVFPPRPVKPQGAALSEDEADKIVRWLLEARQPLLHVGGGIHLAQAADELRKLSESLGVPVSFTLMGKGAMPDDHPLCLGMTGFWGTPYSNQYCRNADRILAIGTRFAEADSSSWDPRFTFAIPPAQLIHIDIDPVEIGRNFGVVTAYVADAKQAIRQLLRAVERLKARGESPGLSAVPVSLWRQQFLREWVEPHRRSNDFPLRPERILGDLREVTPPETIFVTDVGWNKNGFAQQFPLSRPGTFLTPGGLATMGFGPSAVLGVALGRPGVPCVAVVGDGAMGSQLGAIATAVEHNLAVIWVVMNNRAFGTIAGLERSHYGTAYGTEFYRGSEPYSPDFAALGRAFGAQGIQIQSAAEFEKAMRDALASHQPTVIDVPTQNVPVPTDGHWDINDIYQGRFDARQYRPEA